MVFYPDCVSPHFAVVIGQLTRRLDCFPRFDCVKEDGLNSSVKGAAFDLDSERDSLVVRVSQQHSVSIHVVGS